MTESKKNFSLYIHIPFCRKKCAYCDFLSFPRTDCLDEYVFALLKEIYSYKDKCKELVTAVYIGGGTPSLLSSNSLKKIFDALRGSFNIAKDAEISIECNPESVNLDFATAAKSVGINRVSMGVQSCSNDILRIAGRVHDFDMSKKALDLICDNFNNVNADIMLGLPTSKIDDVEFTLDTLLKYPLSHISAYSLILEKGTPFWKMSKKGLNFPVEDDVVNCYDYIANRLHETGFYRYEISNFAKKDKKCLYNDSVWEYYPYLGLGLGASSFLYHDETPFSGQRMKNRTNLIGYIDSVSSGAKAYSRRERIGVDVGKKEYIMLGLRREQGMNIDRFNSLFGADFINDYKSILLKIKDYVDLDDNNLKIKPQYFYVSNDIIVEFF